MVYSLLRFWVGGGLRVWFRKIYASGNQNIPDNSPLIFACTHPNSAVDYTFLPLITRLRSFVMVRGDVFENKWLDKFFRAIWMIPVYRMRDGFSTLNKNTDSFEECYREFDKNGRTLIFSEGTSIQEKKLQPLKKGNGSTSAGLFRVWEKQGDICCSYGEQLFAISAISRNSDDKLW